MEWKWNSEIFLIVEWNGMIENWHGMEWKWNSNFQEFGSLIDTPVEKSYFQCAYE